MISVVICSVDRILAQQVRSNIENTIGVPWQPIFIDNTNPSRPITQVYNDGARQSSNSIICFVHEDVEFKTKDWGQLVMGYFHADANLGMVGVAGAGYKSKTPSGWMTSIPAYDRYSIVHRDREGRDIRMQFDQGPKSLLKPVVCLDGVFLCTRKEVVTHMPFEEKLLTGFHLYDIDISYRISRHYRVTVTYEIDLIHHTQGGDYGDKWIDFTLKWHREHSGKLPGYLAGEDAVAIRKAELQVARFWLKRLAMERISIRNKFRWIFACKAIVKPGLWPNMIFFFFLKTVKSIIGRNGNKVRH